MSIRSICDTNIPVYKKFSNLMQKSVAKWKEVVYNKRARQRRRAW